MIYNFGINDIPGDSIPSSLDYHIYDKWTGIIRRCYSLKRTDKNLSYINTTVCDEWKYYSNFKKWFKLHYIEGYQLDKDIIGGDKDIYSPETCAFIPGLINSCIIDGNRGNNYIGVSYFNDDRCSKKYRPAICKFGKQIRNFGLFHTPEEAHQVWQREKIKYLYEIIEKYSSVVDLRVINGIKRRIDILQYDLDNGLITETISKI
ncbi:TPA: hypothetical protein OGU99_000531 [Escherichia coli]|nr:hypothetical protein A4_405 [Escherichia phage A4]HCQ0858605.1 hypothetical protein [Escherichia coli]